MFICSKMMMMMMMMIYLTAQSSPLSYGDDYVVVWKDCTAAVIMRVMMMSKAFKLSLLQGDDGDIT